MSKFYYKRILTIAMALLATRTAVHAQYWTNGQAASYVIGQPGFGSKAAAVSQTGLTGPIAVAVDPATGKMFVADFTNNRVLRYPSTAAMTDGAAAEAVLGQTNYTSNGKGVIAAGLSNPQGLAIDAAGNLWVADYGNNRVLRYAHAATIASGTAASGVLGQPGFTSNTASVSATAMDLPSGVFCSGATLWVADRDNNRILRYDNAVSKANGGSADAVFGQTDLTGATSGLSATQLDWPRQIYVDGSDNLWVVDGVNDRVLMFPDASTSVSGEAATMVLGQPNMTATGAGTPTTNMSNVWGVYGDGVGNLYVSDAGNDRVLIFANAASLSNGASASYELGQSSFNARVPGDGASQLAEPQMIYVDESLLAVTDFTNERVLIYTPLIPLPLLLKGFTGRLRSNGQALLQWEVSGVGSGLTGGSYTQLEYSITDTSGFTYVLNAQSVDPAVSNYNYVQVSPAAGPNYYRVKLTLPDGSATYSQVVTISVGSGAGAPTALSIYPNPAHNAVVVTLPKAGAAEIDVYSSAGMLVQRVTTGAAVNTVDVSSLPASMYFVRVVQGGTTTTGSFIKTNADTGRLRRYTGDYIADDGAGSDDTPLTLIWQGPPVR